MLLLTGYTLEHVTCGIFKAAPHTVVSRVHHACGKGCLNAPNAFVALSPILGGRSWCGMVGTMSLLSRLLRLCLLLACAQRLAFMLGFWLRPRAVIKCVLAGANVGGLK